MRTVFALMLALVLVSCSKDGSTPVTPPENKPVAPTITSQPVSVSVTAPATATFSVTATGTAPLSYQWQKNGVNMTGATSASYTIPTTSVADSGSLYRCAISNSIGSATSNTAMLTVQPAPVPPSITTQPSSVNVVAGQTATFSVSATGTAPLSYQWKKNGVNLVGATSANYTFTVAYSDSGASITVAVTNIAGSVTSQGASLTVQPLIAVGQPYLGGTIFLLDNSGQHGLVAANVDQSRWVMTTPSQRDSICASYGSGYRQPDSTELRLMRDAWRLGILSGFAVVQPPLVSVYVSSTLMEGNPWYVSSLDMGSGQRSWGGTNTPDAFRAVRSF